MKPAAHVNYLLEGPVSAVTQLCHPEPSGEWRNPDLFWPDDRRWFVATDDIGHVVLGARDRACAGGSVRSSEPRRPFRVATEHDVSFRGCTVRALPSRD
jgi:hypothetical protein